MSSDRTLALVAPDELLRRLLARYAALRAYRDRGVLRVWRAADLPPLEMPFSTAYAAPDRFRFEFHYPHPMPLQPATRYVVGSDGSSAYLYTAFAEQRPELREFPAVGRAIAAASGISCGCAQTIGRLLFPEVRGMALTDLAQLRSLGIIDLSGTRCHRLGGHHPHGGDIELDIASDDLLRRVARRSAGFPVEELRENVEADPLLDPAEFAAPRPGS